MDYITVYDSQLHVAGFINNAVKLSYELKLNDISQAELTLPSMDPACSLLQPRALVSFPDGGRDAGMFRVIAAPDGQPGHLGTTQYRLEHVCACLMDDCIPGFLTLGGTGVYTEDVITALLARQSVQRFQLGECDFHQQFEYTFENTDLLTALFSLGNVLTDPFVWVWDTSTYPWTVSLKAANTDPDSMVIYRRNLVGVTKNMDATTQFTRIYPRGSGEGDNQVNIKSVNNGVEYLDATPAGAAPISTVYVDTSIEDPELLMAAAQKILAAYKDPYYTYEISALDYSIESGLRVDRHMPGDTIKVLDTEDGVEILTRVIAVSKDDVLGDPGDIGLTLANAERDASSQMADLSSRMSVTQLYSQGATNLYSQQYADNAGPQNPGYMRFYVPTECVRINKVLLSWKYEAFRSFEKGAAAAGSISVSTTLGGETTVQSELQATEYAAQLETSGPDPSITATKSADLTSTEDGHGEHNHMIPAHSHGLNGHTHTVPTHRHPIPAHRHELAGHTHIVNASAHTHESVYGIYTGTTATKATLKVDGVQRFVDASSRSEVDVTQYLEMENGRIKRGVWHEIEIVPDKLTRIEANLFVQLFVQSRGGGDF